MVNSLARSSNPSVSVRHPSDILQPKGGVYSFSGVVLFTSSGYGHGAESFQSDAGE